jgi:hypothetical protein
VSKVLLNAVADALRAVGQHVEDVDSNGLESKIRSLLGVIDDETTAEEAVRSAIDALDQANGVCRDLRAERELARSRLGAHSSESLTDALSRLFGDLQGARSVLGAEAHESLTEAIRRRLAGHSRPISPDTMTQDDRFDAATALADISHILEATAGETAVIAASRYVLDHARMKENVDFLNKAIRDQSEEVFRIRGELRDMTTDLRAILDAKDGENAEQAAKRQMIRAGYEAGAAEILGRREDESMSDAAERCMTKIRDLVATVDKMDREIAGSLSGLFPGDSWQAAIAKLVAAYRASPRGAMIVSPAAVDRVCLELHANYRTDAEDVLRAYAQMLIRGGDQESWQPPARGAGYSRGGA